MREDHEQPTGWERLEFFGRITASLSHELKNVLATLNEFSGLLEDLVHAAEQGRPLRTERLLHISGKISKQVARGEELIRRLNRFSHSVDRPGNTQNAGSLLEDILALSRRFARLRQVELRAQAPEDLVRISVDPFGFHHALFLGIELALNAADQVRLVTVSLEHQEGGCEVVIESADPFGAEGAPAGILERLLGVMRELGGAVEWVGSAQGDRLCLNFNARSDRFMDGG